MVVLALAVASSIAILAYVYGDQPIRGDGIEYRRLGAVIASDGLGAFASELRTYGYPSFLAVLIVLVGDDAEALQFAVFVAQLAVYLLASGIGAWRLWRVLGSGSLGVAIFAATVANPLLLLYTVQLLTDLLSAVLIYLTAVLSLPISPAESRRRVGWVGCIAFLLLGLSVMLRPSNVILVGPVALVWAVRAWLFRDVPLVALPAMLAALALPFVPQAAANQRAFGVAHPLIVRELYAEHLHKGVHHAKYITLALPGMPTRAVYLNPFVPPGVDTQDLRRLLRDHPSVYASSVALHAFALLDHDFPFAYVRELAPWYRWPLSILNYLFLMAAAGGFLIGARRREDGVDGGTLRRRRFTLGALGLLCASLFAVYLPTEVESRFSLPLYPLLTVPAVLALTVIPGVVRARSRMQIAVLCTGVGLGLLGACTLSVWFQGLAPVLSEIRAVHAFPPPEQPVAEYVGELPKVWKLGERQAFQVHLVNRGEMTWNASGFYAVTVAVRFSSLSAAQFAVVGRIPRQYYPLPADVPTGGAVTVPLDVQPPAVPGRYKIEVQAFRNGIPDADVALERVVRVER